MASIGFPAFGGASLGRRFHAAAVIAIAAAAAIELAAASMIVFWHGSVSRVLGVVVLGGLVAVLAIRPRSALLIVAGLWGVVHTVLSQTDFGGSVGGQSLNLSRAIGAALVAGLGLALLNLVRQRISVAAPLRAAVLFLALYSVEAVMSPTRSQGFGDLVRVAAGILVGVAAYYVFDREPLLLKLARVVSWAGVIVGVATIMQFTLARVSAGLAAAIFGSASYTYSYNATGTAAAVRVFGPLGGPGETAGFLLVAASFGLMRYALMRETTARLRGQVVGLIVIAAGIVATLTRSSTAGLLILIVLWLVQRQSRALSAVGTRAKVLVVVAVAVLVAVPLLGAKNLQARIWDLNPTTSGQSFAQGRGQIWSLDVARFRSSDPAQVLLGHGAHASYVDLLRSGVPTDTSPHNLIVWLLLDTGILGAAIYLWFLFSAAGAYLRAARVGRYESAGRVGAVALAALVAYQAQGMFTLSPNNPGHGLYFMLFIGATLRAVFDRERWSTPAVPGP